MKATVKNDLSSAQKVAKALGEIASELCRAANKAAFSVGLGTLALGGVLLVGQELGRATSASIGLCALGAFFVCAAVGRLLDRKANL